MDSPSHIVRAKVLGAAATACRDLSLVPGMGAVFLKMSKAHKMTLRLLDETHNREQIEKWKQRICWWDCSF